MRLDVHTGKVVGPPPLPEPTGGIQGTYSPSGRRFALRFADGRFLVYRVPFGGGAFAEYRLPADDRAVSPKRGEHPWQAIAADDRFAVLLTTQALFVLRLPDPPAEKTD